MNTPDTEAVHSVRALLAGNSVKSILITSRYGNVVLPIDEIWYNDDSGALHLSVRVPEPYDLVRTSP